MGLSCCGRTGGPHGRVSTEVGRPTRLHRGVRERVVQQLLKGESTLAEVSRELDIQPSVVRQWKRRFEAGATAAVATNEDVVPVSALREAHQRIRELERRLGKKQMEIEILQAAQEVVKKVRSSGVIAARRTSARTRRRTEFAS